jgi:16S rRNA (guanine527-N7)-methyltransferase
MVPGDRSESQALDALEPYAAFLSRPAAEVAADLEAFAGLLIKWNKTHNLVSRETVDALWPRHIADSLQLLPLVGASDRVFLDIGSGGGFPAIPLAIALRRQHILVEPVGKKASFLKAVSRELRLDLRVENRRAEDVGDFPQIDVITARALARLTDVFSLSARFWGANTQALLHKGRDYSEELAESRTLFEFDVIVTESRTDPRGAILTVNNLVRKRAG